MNFRSISFALWVLTFSATSLSAQVMGNYADQQKTYRNVEVDAQYRAVPKAAEFADARTVEISVNALANREADSYTAIFTVYQAGKTAEETDRLLNERLQAFLAELARLGLGETDTYVDMVNFLPRYEYDVSKKIFSKKTYTEIPSGFEMQKNVHIRYADAELLDRIVTAAARQEIYDIVKVDYFVRNPQAVYNRLRAAAFAYLDSIKIAYAALGVPLDSAFLTTAENAWVAYPINRYESYQAFSTQRLSQEEKSSSVVNPADKPTLRFYNAVPANDYDIVLNPEILQPAVQFSYNLKARFQLPEPKPRVKVETKREFVLVTPEGEVKTLKIE